VEGRFNRQKKRMGESAMMVGKRNVTADLEIRQRVGEMVGRLAK
jgi:hypothetical protein